MNSRSKLVTLIHFHTDKIYKMTEVANLAENVDTINALKKEIFILKSQPILREFTKISKVVCLESRRREYDPGILEAGQNLMTKASNLLESTKSLDVNDLYIQKHVNALTDIIRKWEIYTNK